MAETRQDPREPIPVVGTHPHVERPREQSRIHPDGDVPRDEDEAGDDDGGDDSDDPKAGDAKAPSKKQGKSEHRDDEDDEDGGDGPSKSKGGKGKPADKKEADPKDGDRKEEPPAPPIYKRPFFYVALVVLLVGVVAGVLYYLHSRDYESTDDAFIEGHAIQISPQVAAKVIKVYVDDNTRVRAGDPLVELDPTDYQVAVDQAKGNENASAGRLEQVKAQVASSRAARDESKASLDAANIAFYNSDKDLKRYEALDDRARSKQQYDNAVTAQKNAAAQVDVAKARLASADSQIAVAIANVTASEGEYENAVANRRRAEVNLGYCHITAPGTLGDSARVTTKNVEEGMYAAAGTPLFALVEEHVWVVANYKETQLTNMRLNQPVTLEIDAYPDQKFNAHIDSIQAGSGSRFSVLPAENATGNYVKVVQRVPVKIVFEENQTKDPNRVLVPGMSVTPYVKIR